MANLTLDEALDITKRVWGGERVFVEYRGFLPAQFRTQLGKFVQGNSYQIEDCIFNCLDDNGTVQSIDRDNYLIYAEKLRNSRIIGIGFKFRDTVEKNMFNTTSYNLFSRVSNP